MLSKEAAQLQSCCESAAKHAVFEGGMNELEGDEQTIEGAVGGRLNLVQLHCVRRKQSVTLVQHIELRLTNSALTCEEERIESRSKLRAKETTPKNREGRWWLRELSGK